MMGLAHKTAIQVLYAFSSKKIKNSGGSILFFLRQVQCFFFRDSMLFYIYLYNALLVKKEFVNAFCQKIKRIC